MSKPIDPSLASALDSAPAPAARADLLLDYLDRHGQSNYDESVTQVAHALQSATLARNEGASAELISAALLHDLGHLLVDEHASAGDFLQYDLGHEKVAADYLAPIFEDAVVEPIRLHVPAKRYLCTIDPDYHGGLSNASKRSLEVQGGLLDDGEFEALRELAYIDDAVRLRRWDDRAKEAGRATPPLSDFRDELIAALLSAPVAASGDE